MIARYHQLLLRMAGWAPDDLIADARELLAQGRVSEAGRAVFEAVVADRLPIRPDDAELLVRTLPEVPGIAALAHAVPALDPDATPAFDWAPVLPSPLTPDQPLPLVLDLTTAEDPARVREPAEDQGPDKTDRAVIDALGELPEAIALWRAWRSPQPERAAGGPVRVYLLETAADPAAMPGATSWLQQALVAAGIEEPQVEVFGVEPPPYQRMARGRSALLWAAAQPQPVRVARVFDSFDPVLGGQFAAEHPLIGAGDELDRVLAYLDAGAVLLATTARETDIFDDGAGEVVPASFRTDGTWIWTDAVPYYLRTYALSPDVEMLAHIRALNYHAPTVSAVAEHRAMAVLIG